ncbi:hypothetical protein [Halomicrococcus sp. SG-WS-1]|uniref:hypothetical protein n=1 Tax=Halomicrococcus sp. SG-WS-1 TaxID=3439057 RepID=UPI003F79568C
MSGGENPIGQLISAVFILIVGLTIIQVLGGSDPGNTLLVEIMDSSELIIKGLILLVIIGVIAGISGE